MSLALPTGRRGQFLALGLTAVMLAVVWVGVVNPVLGWYGSRSALLAQRRSLAAHMQELAASVPDLRREAEAAVAAGPVRTALLAGDSDAVAGATLQERVQQMATDAGASLTSAETLPVESASGYRRIGVRVALTASWPVLVQLLRSIEAATPRMLVDDLLFQASPMLAPKGEQPLDAAFTVFAFRQGQAPPRQATEQ
jgi:general secretion pathway protein M